ncbi:MAG: bifunctional acetate--CoA ligase family protein/GNAT family N-acetyltransferase [Candidatus Zixiibacteriota bacterium]
MDQFNPLDRIFKPERIALIGVTPNPKSVGGQVLQNLVGSGFRGVVYPVNKQFESVLGIQCFSDVSSLPRTPDLGVICTGADKVPDLVKQCGEAGILGIIIMAAGFKETGERGLELEKQIIEEAKKYDGMRIMGPNCLGIINPYGPLNVSFAAGTPKKGNVAFISQSGALCTSVLDWALKENVGFSHFVSIGNTLDVNFGDLIDYFGEDENTKSIILYAESISEARQFMTAARAFARTKPIIAYKAGRFPESAEVASSHTGAMAAEDEVYDAAFNRVGIARVFDIGEIFDVAELIGRHRLPEGPKLGIVTNAGGPGVMATDALIAAGGELAKLSDVTMNRLNERLPPFWSHGNPVDVLGDARSKRFGRAVRFVLEDDNVDAVLAILTPQAMTNPRACAKAIGKLVEKSKKPILAAWLGGETMEEGIRILNKSGVATFDTPRRAITAFMTMVKYNENVEALYETPREVDIKFPAERFKLRDRFVNLVEDKSQILSEEVSKTLLQSYGIQVTMPHLAVSPEAAAKIADYMGYPVVLKVLSPDITHKSDVGGVSLDLRNADMVKADFNKIYENAKKNAPEARIDGVTVQPMIDTSDGVEMILGIKRDPVFGMVIMVGMGGTKTEIFQDSVLGFPPLNERLARHMIESLRIYPLLAGFRHHKAIDLDALIKTLIKLSYLAVDYPEIKELDVNPLLVTPRGAMALDGRVVIDKEMLHKKQEEFAHLVFRPYPEEYIHSMTFDGEDITLRPIKPEDEPMWLDLLGNCSQECLYARFRYFFNWNTHDVASRYCFIDYDREMAIVPEMVEDGQRKLLGVGRLIADYAHDTVEFAILILDKWQNRGLGGLLTDYCMEIAKRWGLNRVIAQTTTDNKRMIKVFEARDFELEFDHKNGIVDVELDLDQNKEYFKR